MSKLPNNRAVIAVGDKVLVLQHRYESRDGAMARAEALVDELYPAEPDPQPEEAA